MDKECPDCKVPMDRVQDESSGLEFDRCSRCGGVWLDPGELDTIKTSVLDAPEGEGGNTARDIALGLCE